MKLNLLLSRYKVPLNVVGLWVLLRIITSVWIAIVSSLSPLTEIEKSIPLWPPSAPISAWLERALLAPWHRWDASYFMSIVSDGYSVDNGTAAFHPLYPLLAKPLWYLGFHPLLSLLIVSSVAGLLMILAMYWLASFDINAEDASTGIFLYLFFPSAFVLFAPYTESLFLLFTVLSLLFSRKRNWGLTGLAGCLATLTRQQGIFLILPVAWEYWEIHQRDWIVIITRWREWISLGLIPLGFVIWISYRAVYLSDVYFDIHNPVSFIHSVILSPNTKLVVPQFEFMWPWRAYGFAFSKAIRYPDLDLVINLFLGTLLVILMFMTWKNIRNSYRWYIFIVMMIGLSDHTGPFHPYMGLPRHLWLAFPIFIGLAPLVRRPWIRLAAVGSGLIGMLFLLLVNGFEAWVP